MELHGNSIHNSESFTSNIFYLYNFDMKSNFPKEFVDGYVECTVVKVKLYNLGQYLANDQYFIAKYIIKKNCYRNR